MPQIASSKNSLPSEKIIKDHFQKKIAQDPNLKFLKPLQKRQPKLELYLVGGIVRDMLLNRLGVKDYDFLARGISLTTLQTALKHYGRVNLVGKTFGVLKFQPHKSTLKEPLDFALPRQEKAGGSGAYKDFKVKTGSRLPVKFDLARRDFTINALAWDLKKSKLLDPFHGQVDLKQKIIRGVGQSTKRFQEDYSRLLRGLRLACQLDFQIEPKTWQALKKILPKINDCKKQQFIVPRETLNRELFKMLAANPVRALDLLDKSSALKQILPEIFQLKRQNKKLWNNINLKLKKLASSEFSKRFPHYQITAELVLSILFQGLRQKNVAPVEPIGRRLKFSNAQIKQIDSLVKNHQPMPKRDYQIAQRFLDNPWGDDQLRLLALDIKTKNDEQKFQTLNQRLREIKKNRQKYPRPILNGTKIQAVLNIPSGPLVGLALQILSALADENKIANAPQAERFLTKNKGKLFALAKKLPRISSAKLTDSFVARVKS